MIHFNNTTLFCLVACEGGEVSGERRDRYCGATPRLATPYNIIVLLLLLSVRLVCEYRSHIFYKKR